MTDTDLIEILQKADCLKVTPLKFKMLFTGSERIAIKAARQTDTVLDDFFDIVDDTRCEEVDFGLNSTKIIFDHMVSENLLTTERRVQICAGQVQ